MEKNKLILKLDIPRSEDFDIIILTEDNKELTKINVKNDDDYSNINLVNEFLIKNIISYNCLEIALTENAKKYIQNSGFWGETGKQIIELLKKHEKMNIKKLLIFIPN